jgi:hypothetical protein
MMAGGAACDRRHPIGGQFRAPRIGPRFIGINPGATGFATATSRFRLSF